MSAVSAPDQGAIGAKAMTPDDIERLTAILAKNKRRGLDSEQASRVGRIAVEKRRGEA